MEVSEYLVNFVSGYPSDGKYRVITDGAPSKTTKVFFGVPQGSILEPLLFLAFINDLPHGILSNCDTFAADGISYRVRKIRNALRVILKLSAPGSKRSLDRS